jgi:RNA polymerase sigma factor (sigma-70 family)
MAATSQLERPIRRARLPSRSGRSTLGPGPLVPLGRSSDERLARRATKGDGQALGAIFERYQQELYGFCLGLLGEPQDAQDALQNTMVKALRALPGEEREIALRPWLYRVAHNEAINLRRTKRETQTLDGHLLDVHSSVAETAEHRERLEWLFRDLSDLPERQRAVLVMRELSGLDFADIGAALGTSGGVVRQTLYEARRNLEQMDSGRGMRCEAVTRVLSEADGRVSGRRQIRAHLRHCLDCRRFQDRMEGRKETFAGVALPPSALAGGLLRSAAAGTGGSGTAGITAALGGGAAKSAGTVVAMKAVVAVAAVAVIGTVAVDRNSREHRVTSDGTAAPLSRHGHVARSPSPAAERRLPQRLSYSAHDESAVGAPIATSGYLAAAAPRRGSATPDHRASRDPIVALSGESPPAASRAAGQSAPPAMATDTPPKATKQQEKAKRKQEHAANAEAKAEEKTANVEAQGKPEHAAHSDHPAHLAHPQKTFVPMQPAPSAQEAETTPAPEAEGSPESIPQSPKGKAKGHETQTSG